MSSLVTEKDGMGLGSLRLIQEESPAGRVRGGGGEAQGRKGGTMGCTKVGPIASHGFPSQAQTRPRPACSHLSYCNHPRPEPPKTSRQGALSARALVSSMHAISHTNDNTDIRMGRGVSQLLPQRDPHRKSHPAATRHCMSPHAGDTGWKLQVPGLGASNKPLPTCLSLNCS